MRIIQVRRISQFFFLFLFLWFCIVSSFGTRWWQLRGWPVNWFLQLDPLVAIGTILTTGRLYSGLLWSLLTVAMTVLLGRFFCGWVCPFGSTHQLIGYLGKRGKPISHRVAINKYHWAHSIKYLILFFLLSSAVASLLMRIPVGIGYKPVLLFICLAFISSPVLYYKWKPKMVGGIILPLIGISIVTALFLSLDQTNGPALQTGLLDPIPLFHRSINLALLPISDSGSNLLSSGQRYYEGAWLIGLIFLSALVMNLKSPRFYCRYICPLGALFGLLSRYCLFRIDRWRITKSTCKQCKSCEADCEGACEPSGFVRSPECVLCMNCMHQCKEGLVTYGLSRSSAGTIDAPDLSRRGIVVAFASGIVALPLLELNGFASKNWPLGIIRPPGALPESEFLARCIKCSQCMRICPTNIIQPAGSETGIESIWTPLLNFRIGSSGCQLNCVACSHICPTAALRPISLDEKLGLKEFSEKGPIRIGTAFLDHGRCLPWSMDKPCIVCQENCPVSPKAIFVKEYYSTIRGGTVSVKNADHLSIEIQGVSLRPDSFATGDYFIKPATAGDKERRILVGNTDRSLKIAASNPLQVPLSPGDILEIQVRLQRPHIDIERCIGCGVCEHECPVSGKRAIRISAENESRNKGHSLVVSRLP